MNNTINKDLNNVKINNNIKLLTDTIPYLPDIYLKNNDYFKADITNNKTSIPVNRTIFIVRLKPTHSSNLNKYNNPYYMFYGAKVSNTEYYLPPINYFSAPLTTTSSTSSTDSDFYNNYMNSISIVEHSLKITNKIANLLKDIGFTECMINNIISPSEYNLGSSQENIDENILYQKINIIDYLTGRNDTIYFIFFYIQDTNDINYNNYKSTVFYHEENWNVFIYPYIEEISTLQISTFNSYIQLTNNISNPNINYLQDINFDSREYCPFIDKIDYKYFENKDFYKKVSKLDNCINYGKNISVFGNFINTETKFDDNSETIIISLNEINKISESTLDENKSSISKKITINHINNYQLQSNVNNYYSLSFDDKITYLNKKYINIDKKYAPYFYQTNRTQTMYPISKSYYIDNYINICNIEQVIDKSNGINNLLNITNNYLFKILLLINPLIINTEIYEQIELKLEVDNYVKSNNMLIFDGIKLKYTNTIVQTNTYYIDRIKVTVKFKSFLNNEYFVYYIIINLLYYNGKKIIFNDITRTPFLNDLGYINYTMLDMSMSIQPTILTFTNNYYIYNNLIDYGLINMKYYSMIINYNNLTTNKSDYNLILINHFYANISYIDPSLKYNLTNISNYFNLVEKQMNNFITNLVLINFNYNSIKFNNYNAESNFKLSLVIDNNLPSKYLDHLTYIKIPFPDNFPYIKMINDNILLPSGNYKILKYNNIFPVAPITDDLVFNIKTISDMFNYNYCLLIKHNDNYNLDDTFFVDSENNCIHTQNFDNYSGLYTNLTSNEYLYNIGNYKTKIYIALCDENTNIYWYNNTYIVCKELFNYKNSCTEKLNGTNIFINLITTQYMNFYQMNFQIEVYTNLTEQNTLILDKNNLIFKLHNNIPKEIIEYDSKRFCSNIKDDIKYEYDIKLITKLHNNKLLLHYLYINNNNLLFIFNCFKILTLLKKCLYYLKQLKDIIFFKQQSYELVILNTSFDSLLKKYYIEIINLLANNCIKINNNNIILNITFSNQITLVDNILQQLLNLTDSISISEIINLIYLIQSIINYYTNRIYLILNNDDIYNNISNYSKTYYNNYNDYIILYKNIILELIFNNTILELIDNDINNIINNITITSLIDNSNIKQIILERCNKYKNTFFIYKLNLNKLYEIICMVRLFYPINQTYNVDKTVYQIFSTSNINNSIIKFNYIYNTTYYNNVNNISNYNIFTEYDNYKINHPTYQTSIDLINNIILQFNLLVLMMADTYKKTNINPVIVYTYDIYTVTGLELFNDTIIELENNINTITTRSEFIADIDYSLSLTKEFIINCKELIIFVKSKFYIESILLNQSDIYSNQSDIYLNQTDINLYKPQLLIIFDLINNINNNPNKVVDFYCISTSLNSKKFDIIIDIIKKSKFIDTAYIYKIILNNQFIDSNFELKYIKLGYQGETLIPFNDYNYLIEKNNYIFNSNNSLICLIELFNIIKKNIILYYINTTYPDKYKLIKNALYYGFIDSKYILVNIANLNN